MWRGRQREASPPGGEAGVVPGDTTSELTRVPDELVAVAMARRMAESDRMVLVTSILATVVVAAIFIPYAPPAAMAVFLVARSTSTVFSVAADRVVVRMQADDVRAMRAWLDGAALFRAASWTVICAFYSGPVLEDSATTLGVMTLVALQGSIVLATMFSVRAMVASVVAFLIVVVARVEMIGDPQHLAIIVGGLIYGAVVLHFGVSLNRHMVASQRAGLVTDGLLRHVSTLHARVRDQRDELAEVNLQLQDALLRSTELATHDALTGALNRRAFLAGLKDCDTPDCERCEGAILLIDFDHFKDVNDQHGHAVGDAVLAHAAQALAASLRPEDVLVRWGGEEFIAHLPGTDLRSAERVADRLRCAVRDAEHGDWPAEVTITVSVGVAPFVQHAGFDAAFTAADTALYRAKALGRDRVQVAASVH